MSLRRRQPHRDARPDRRARRHDDLHRRALRRPRPAGNQMDPVTWTFTTDTPDTTSPTVTGRTPAVGATGVALGVSPTATFSEAVQQATIAFEVRGPGNTLVPATTTYDAASRTATLDPSANLAASTTYTVNAQRRTGRLGQPDGPGVLVVHHDGRRLGLPVHDLAVDGDPGRHRPRHQLGRARREVPSQHRRLRHRHPLLPAHARPPAPTSAALWTRTGTRLGQVTFTDEARPAGGSRRPSPRRSPSPPERRTSRPTSRPAATSPNCAYFATSATTRGPLTALQNGTDGGNGLYRYTSTPEHVPRPDLQQRELLGRRRLRGRSRHHQADRHGTHPCVRAPPAVSVGADVTATFSEPVQQSTLGLELRGPGGTLVAGHHVVRRRDPHGHPRPDGEPHRRPRPYTATVTGVRDTAGNLIDPVSWTFTTDTPDTTKPDRSAAAHPRPARAASRPRSTRPRPSARRSSRRTIAFELRTPADALVAGTTTYDAAEPHRDPRPDREPRAPARPTPRRSAAPATPPATRWTR